MLLINGTNSTSNITEDFCKGFSYIFNYINTVTSIIGLFTNIFCCIVFVKIVRNGNTESQLFKYLLVKSNNDTILMFYFLIEYLVELINTYLNASLRNTYIYGFCSIWGMSWLKYCLMTISAWLEVAATFDCCFGIANRMTCYRSKWTFATVCIVTIVLSCAFLTYYPLYYVQSENNVILSNRYSETVRQYFDILTSLIEDVIPVFILCVLNTYIFYSLRTSTHRKRRLLGQQSASSVALSVAEKVERSKLVMIIVTSIFF